MPTPIWNKKRKLWILAKQHDGKRMFFYSSKPGPAGRADVKRQMDDWLFGVTSNKTRLRDVKEGFLADVAARGGSESVAQRTNYMDNYLIPAVEFKLVSQISNQDWQDIINHAAIAGKKGKPLSRKSLSNLRSTITDFCRYANSAWLTDKKPTLYIPKKAVKGKRTIIQPAQFKLLFDPADDDLWYINAWRLMAVTGMRPGEIYGLKRDDVEGGQIVIRRAINRLGEETEGKTENAQRTIYQHPISSAIIENQKVKLSAKGKLTAWLFPGDDLDFAHHIIVYKAWKEFSASKGITCSPYELRHTFVSIMKASVPEELMKLVVGHSASMSTYETYGHEVDGEAAEAAKLIGEKLTTLLYNTHSAPPRIVEQVQDAISPEIRPSDG